MDYEPKDPGQNRKDQTGENKPPNLEDAMTHLFERFGWSGKAGGTKKGGRGRKKPRRRGSWAVFAVVAVALASLGTLAGIWTDYLWFQQLGYAGIFLTRIWARAALSGAGGVAFFAIFFGNIYLARRLSPRIRVASRETEGDVLELVTTDERSVGRLTLLVSVVLALFVAIAAGNAWEEFLLFLNRQPFGYIDPIFARDTSFYVYVLPVINRILSYLSFTFFLSLAGTAAVYALARAVTLDEKGRPSLAPHVKGHLSVLAAMILFTKAGGYLLSTWELVFSGRGVAFGASYTDIHAELPVLRILAVVAAISAVLLLVNIHYRGWRLPAVGVGLLLITWLLAGQIYPTVVQQYRVSPNESQLESEYIDYNIESTRWAFGLDKTSVRDFPSEETLTQEQLEKHSATVTNIRLWDPRPLMDTYRQIQEIRLYYSFQDVDVDRYEIDGNYRQLMLAARELDQSKLQDRSKTWVNEHLVYTHGYGVVASPVNEVTPEGLPELLVKDIPPKTSTDLEIKQPEIYYGELGNEFVLVNTQAQEFDYPQGDTNVYSTYSGKGGVGLSSSLRKVAYALRFGTLKMLLAEDITSDSRVMYRRTLKERVRAIAPFLSYDTDPYIVIRDDGSLSWIWDAYTVTDRQPYSEPRPDGTNYIRNSVKVVVNTYDGDVTFYQMDPEDSLATTWGNVYPELLQSAEDMPEDIRRHIRYPEDLLRVQSEVLGTYHMEDSQVFYNKEDVWEIPTETYSGEEVPVVPYYVIMGLPEGGKEEFLLLQPFSPLTRNNMIAWMGARMDGEHYGELILYEFPKDKLVYGPSQIEARISNHPEISSQITLWDQAGSRVIRGNLLVIPVGDSILYVEPLYLQASESPIPELARVIVSYRDRIAMEPTLSEALEGVFKAEPFEEPAATDGGEPTAGATTTTVPDQTTTSVTTPTTQTTELPTGGTGNREELIRQAQEAYTSALEAQKQGDWTEYGRQIDQLGRLLEQLDRLQQ